MTDQPIRVAVNGYGAIGKRVADAVRLQDDMLLVGVADLASDWRPGIAVAKGIDLFLGETDRDDMTGEPGFDPVGTLRDLLAITDVIVDCTPKGVGAKNAARYREAGVKFVVQGGEKHATTGHSFVADSTYTTALDRDSTRVVSCNTTSIVRTLTALKRAGLLGRARGTLIRRATDPWESHMGGILNTIVPEATIPSHQAPDAQSVDPELDVVTVAVKVPETLAHVHYWCVDLARETDREAVLAAFASSSRIAGVRLARGLSAINAVKEMALDHGHDRGDIHEVVLWEDLVTVLGRELHYAYMVDNQAIVIPETIDAIRALWGRERSAEASIGRTDRALGIPGIGERSASARPEDSGVEKAGSSCT